MRAHYFLLLAPLLLTHPAYAQGGDASGADRIEQLEQDVLLLKRQQDRARLNGDNATAPAEASTGGDVGSAQTNVRIGALEQEIKLLRGQLEEKDFAIRKLSDENERFKKDTEFRLGELEKSAQAAAAAAAAVPPAPAAPEKPPEKTLKKKLDVSVKEVPEKPAAAEAPAKPEAAPAAPKPEEKPAAEATPPASPAGDTPRDHYNYAFRLLNQNQYEEASKSFADFVKKFPKDPLVGNAYYWQGETFYIRKDFAASADNFRQGFEAMPNGPKAGDNLLKLGMSLAALKKDKEACVVLSQVMTKFKTASATIAAKAEAEHKRIGCE